MQLQIIVVDCPRPPLQISPVLANFAKRARAATNSSMVIITSTVKRHAVVRTTANSKTWRLRTEEERCSRVELYAGKGKPGEYGYQASRYGWCCRTISETAGPQIDVCDPHTDDICECYSIATRTTKCRTPDGQIINGARGGRIIDPKECEFGFTDELGLRCSVVWSTNDQRCGLSYKGTHDEFCDDHFGDRDSCQTSSCCLWSNGGSTCKGWSSTTCNIYRTWSREELERVSALKCPSGGRKLNANMISSTVCLKRNGHSAEDCWNIGCLRCVLIVCAV